MFPVSTLKLTFYVITTMPTKPIHLLLLPLPLCLPLVFRFRSSCSNHKRLLNQPIHNFSLPKKTSPTQQVTPPPWFTVPPPIIPSPAIPFFVFPAFAPTTLAFFPLILGSKPLLMPQFIFSCSNNTSLINDILNGLIGLGRSNISLPAQVTTLLSSPYLFALCLSGSPSAPGVAFFTTTGPYYFLPQIDLSKSLIYTPLISKPDGNFYFIGVTSMKVNGKALQLNQTIMAGGTMISTVDPYTVLHTSIYKAFTEAFVEESAALNLTVTAPVEPFGVCYPADDVMSTRVGPAVPTVDLVMESDDVFWRVFESNSMVRIFGDDVDVWCLGFVDGGVEGRASIVIGGHQMEDNLLQYDLELERLGFTSSVLVHNTTCANFNFTANTNLQ